MLIYKKATPEGINKNIIRNHKISLTVVRLM